MSESNCYKIEDMIDSIKPLLDEIDYDKEEGIDKIRDITQEILGSIIFSMRGSREYNFFSVMLDKINIELDYQLPAAAACNFIGNVFNIYFNPFIAFKYDKYFIREFIIHEVYHIMLNHLIRLKSYQKSGDYSQEIINKGLDVAINQYLSLLTCENGFCNLETISKLSKISVESIKKNESCEYYIEILKNSERNFSPNMIKKMLEKENNNSSSESNNIDNEKENKNNSSNLDNDSKETSKGNKVIKNYGDNNHSKMFEDDNGTSYDVQKFILDMMLREAISKTRGNIPAGLDAVIEELFREPIIRWQDVLKNYIGRIPIPFKRTCTRLDRRQPHRLDIQGKLPDAFYKIVCVIDVSGSMSDEDVAICLNEVLSIVSLQKKKFDITVIEFDVEISSIYHIKNKRDIKKIKRTSCGGTCFSPVFKYLRENKRYYKDAVTLFFTDGCGEQKLTTKPLNNQLIWILTDNVKDLSVKDNVGRRLELRLDDIRKKRRK